MRCEFSLSSWELKKSPLYYVECRAGLLKFSGESGYFVAMSANLVWPGAVKKGKYPLLEELSSVPTCGPICLFLPDRRAATFRSVLSDTPCWCNYNAIHVGLLSGPMQVGFWPAGKFKLHWRESNPWSTNHGAMLRMLRRVLFCSFVIPDNDPESFRCWDWGKMLNQTCLPTKQVQHDVLSICWICVLFFWFLPIYLLRVGSWVVGYGWLG